MLKNGRDPSINDSVDDLIVNELRNKKTAVLYLQTALNEYQVDANAEVLMQALRYVAEAQGGIAKLSRKTKLNRESLYKTLSSRGNPKLQTLMLLIKALGFQLSVKLA